MKYLKFFALLVLFTALAIGSSALITSCTNSPTPTEPADLNKGPGEDSTIADNGEGKGGAPSTALSLSGSMTIAWPFGSLQRMQDWTGWEDIRTPGSTKGAPFCNGRPSTHSGAEYYARDLNQKKGLDYGIWVFSGIAGRIVKAGWQNGYGYTVVVYDKSRHVAVRYAHLSYIYPSAYVGRLIPETFFLGCTGNSGNTEGTHLHIVGYENINDNNGHPIIPTLCDSDFYACKITFYQWQY